MSVVTEKRVGQAVTIQSITGWLGLNERETDEWNPCLRKIEGPGMLYCPESGMRLPDSRQVYLFSYRDVEGKTHAQLIKDLSTIPAECLDVEVYQGRNDPRGQKWWKDIVLENIRKVGYQSVAPQKSASKIPEATNRRNSDAHGNGKPPRNARFSGNKKVR